MSEYNYNWAQRVWHWIVFTFYMPVRYRIDLYRRRKEVIRRFEAFKRERGIDKRIARLKGKV